jgi:hypothetical protein
MTGKILLHALMLSIALTGCRKTEMEDAGTSSELIFKAFQPEIITGAGDEANVEQVIFTGDDILWFNVSTKEIRFKNNYSGKTVLEAVNTNSIRFYINDEYLFSSMLCVSSLSSQTFNSPVFYYNIIENKFFLTDGYPEASVLPDMQKAQAERDDNMRKIANEWSRFLDRLKLEGKYQKL